MEDTLPLPNLDIGLQTILRYKIINLGLVCLSPLVWLNDKCIQVVASRIARWQAKAQRILEGRPSVHHNPNEYIPMDRLPVYNIPMRRGFQSIQTTTNGPVSDVLLALGEAIQLCSCLSRNAHEYYIIYVVCWGSSKGGVCQVLMRVYEGESANVSIHQELGWENHKSCQRAADGWLFSETRVIYETCWRSQLKMLVLSSV